MARTQIIHIDDETEMTDIIRLILGRKGFDVIGADGGRAGLAAVQQTKPDLILLNLMMSDMDGWEVNQRLKADEKLKDIPVIIVSAKHPTPALLAEIGPIDGYVIAPYAPQELIDSIKVLQARRDQANSQ